MGIYIRDYHRCVSPLSSVGLQLTVYFTGPYGANFFNPRSWGYGSDTEESIDVITIEFTRIVLAVGMFAIGVELPKAYMMKHWKSLFFLLVPGTIWVCPRFHLYFLEF